MPGRPHVLAIQKTNTDLSVAEELNEDTGLHFMCFKGGF